VHRDLKSENVMITREGRVKVLDFGLSKQLMTAAGDNTSTIALSTPGMEMGTVGYMSPEHLRGEPRFGCVLYELPAPSALPRLSRP
jgi:serine/threonine protein kinase